jgi:hypothetical protein
MTKDARLAQKLTVAAYQIIRVGRRKMGPYNRLTRFEWRGSVRSEHARTVPVRSY